jgi:type II secretory ATPase GspE/PulE/Tfp pilus assembly ATPase PilB-like protein
MASSAGRESVEVAMPSSALTRFLKQRLARGMCPLCRVTHKLDREFT